MARLHHTTTHKKFTMILIIIYLLLLCLGLGGLLLFVKLNKVVWSTIPYTLPRFAVFLVICAVIYRQVGLYLGLYLDLDCLDLDLITALKVKYLLLNAYWEVQFMIFEIYPSILQYLDSLESYIPRFTKHLIFNFLNLCVLITAIFILIVEIHVLIVESFAFFIMFLLQIGIKYVFKLMCFFLLGDSHTIFFELVIETVWLWFNDHVMVFWLIHCALFGFFYALSLYTLYALYTRKQPKADQFLDKTKSKRKP